MDIDSVSYITLTRGKHGIVILTILLYNKIVSESNL